LDRFVHKRSEHSSGRFAALAAADTPVAAGNDKSSPLGGRFILSTDQAKNEGIWKGISNT